MKYENQAVDRFPAPTRCFANNFFEIQQVYFKTTTVVPRHNDFSCPIYHLIFRRNASRPSHPCAHPRGTAAPRRPRPSLPHLNPPHGLRLRTAVPPPNGSHPGLLHHVFHPPNRVNGGCWSGTLPPPPWEDAAGWTCFGLGLFG